MTTPWQKAKRLARGEDAAPLTALTRDLAFHPRTVAEWDEYVSERIAIGVYERGMTLEDSTAGAHALAGPRPGPWEQQGLPRKTP